MSDDSYLLDSKDKKNKEPVNWIGRLLKISFFLIAFVLVIITVLANMGGTNETLRGGVVQFISSLTGGRPVKVEKLNYMGFFPTVSIDIEGITVHAKPDDKIALIRLERLQASMPFWNVATKTPRLTQLYIEGVEAIKGMVFPEEFSIKKIFIDHDMESEIAKIRGSGKVGVHPWSFEIGMDVNGSKDNYGYMLADEAPLMLDVADLHFETVFVRENAKYYRLKDFIISYGEKELSGDLALSSLGNDLLKIKGTFKTRDDRTVLSPDLVVAFAKDRFSRVSVSGDVTSEKLNINDLVGDESVYSILSRAREIVGYKKIPSSKEGGLEFLGSNDLDLSFDLKNVDANGQIHPELKFDLVQDVGRVKLGPISGANGQLMPTLMLLYKHGTNQMVSIIEEGVFDISLVKSWLKNLPRNLLDRRQLNVECGIVELSNSDQGTTIDAFAINAQTGSIGVQEKAISSDQGLSDMHFLYSSSPTKLKSLELSEGLYDFVQGSFQKSDKGSPCAAYITKVAPQAPVQEPAENKVDQE